MFKPDPDDWKPCPHMRTLVSAWVDGALHGLRRRYTEWHVAHCPRCTQAVPILRTLRARLRRVGDRDTPELGLAPERRAAVEEAWRQADQSSAAPPPS